MAKAKIQGVRLPASSEIGDLPAAVAVLPEEPCGDKAGPGVFRITLRGARWLPGCVVVEGASNCDEARQVLHELLDRAILQVEKAR